MSIDTIRERDAAMPRTGNGITRQFGRGHGAQAIRDRRDLLAEVDRLESLLDLRTNFIRDSAEAERARIRAAVEGLGARITVGDFKPLDLLDRAAVLAAIDGR